ncbi:MAG: long-chain fatty acid--CoA ligase [Proteobacteria bacterium]|nr:long-chain fatty acid--CoA ligase [Pseudomonadota bacterium]MCP4915920.1 long-chain fatty acid--CoA ligase [Pseudomonadota bacterium]
MSWLTPSEAPALFDVDTDRRWTHSELARDARRWAAWLAGEGMGEADVVALIAKNRAEHVLLLLACEHLGAVFQPVNWRLSTVEIHWQLDHSGAHVVLADDAFLCERSRELPELPDAELSEAARADDETWVLMYTSGTTGSPKGALLTHGQLRHNAAVTQVACSLSDASSTLTFTPLFHTGGLNCLTTPVLRHGGCIVLTSGLDSAQALALIADERVTHLMGVPTIFQLLADDSAFSTTDFSSVQDALCGGASLSMPLLERYLEAGIPLRQGFGLTEVGPNCFSMPVARVREKLGSVGQPIVEARLVRADGTVCAPGESGELQLRGPSVFGGYLGLPSPLTDGWFGTGDILSRDDDGFYTVRGRLKEMFISGGENIYPAEVEASLLTCQGVAQCAVIGVPDARWGEVGHAFVEGTGQPESILGELRERIARFKVPKQLVILDALPRTASGKIDKVRLKETHA